MSTISDNDLDKVFKDAAEKYKSTFDDSAWEAMEERLNPGWNGFGYFQAIGGIIGLFIVGAILIWWYTPEGVNDALRIHALNHTHSTIGPTSSNSLSISDSLSKEPKRSANNYSDDVIGESRTDLSPGDNKKQYTDRYNDQRNISNKQNNLKSIDQNQLRQVQAGLPSSGTGVKVSGRTSHLRPEAKQSSPPTTFSDKIDPNFVKRLSYLNPEHGLTAGALSKVKTNQNKEKKTVTRHIAIKLAYSPDLTSVGYFDPGRTGSNFGLMLEYFIARRWSISTGAMFSRKLYFTDEKQSYSGYGGSSDTYSSINGDCRVIDIPLNISYYLKQSDKHSLFLTAGSSSYLMLKEIYDYTTVTNGYQHEWAQEFENENNHFFGILNLSIGYERRIKRNFFLQVEPFIKAPVAGIGEGKVDLVSTGAFLNLKYRFR